MGCYAPAARHWHVPGEGGVGRLIARTHGVPTRPRGTIWRMRALLTDQDILNLTATAQQRQRQNFKLPCVPVSFHGGTVGGLKVTCTSPRSVTTQKARHDPSSDIQLRIEGLIP